MVTKDRLSGLIDAIIAVIMTIMLLEFHLPNDGSIVSFLHENLVYMITYLLSFLYVVTSWYNQQYMMRQVAHVTRRMYHATMLWVLSLSLLPILAAWTGRTIDLFHHFGANSPKAPALLFFIMIFLWGISYVHMTNVFIADSPEENALKIKKMDVIGWLGHPIYRVLNIIVFILTYFYPPFVFVFTAFEMTMALVRSRNQEN